MQHTTRTRIDGRWRKVPKRAFDTPEEAWLTILRLQQEGKDLDSEHPFTFYLCPFCNKWHIGRSSSRNMRIRGIPILTGNETRDRYILLSLLYRRIRRLAIYSGENETSKSAV